MDNFKRYFVENGYSQIMLPINKVDLSGIDHGIFSHVVIEQCVIVLCGGSLTGIREFNRMLDLAKASSEGKLALTDQDLKIRAYEKLRKAILTHLPLEMLINENSTNLREQKLILRKITNELLGLSVY